MCEWQKNMHKSERDLYLATAGLGTQALLYCLIYYKHKVDKLHRFKQREEEARLINKLFLFLDFKEISITQFFTYFR